MSSEPDEYLSMSSRGKGDRVGGEMAPYEGYPIHHTDTTLLGPFPLPLNEGPVIEVAKQRVSYVK